MRVDRRRVHVAVANRGQGFHAEEKRAREGTRRHPVDTRAAQAIEAGEEHVERHVAAEQERREPRPSEGQQPMVGVAPVAPADVDFEELDAVGVARGLLHADQGKFKRATKLPVVSTW